MEKTETTTTGMGLYNSVNAIINLIKAPGSLFNTNEYGLNYGIIFVAVIGSILAVTGIVFGLH